MLPGTSSSTLERQKERQRLRGVKEFEFHRSHPSGVEVPSRMLFQSPNNPASRRSAPPATAVAPATTGSTVLARVRGARVP